MPANICVCYLDESYRVVSWFISMEVNREGYLEVLRNNMCLRWFMLQFCFRDDEVLEVMTDDEAQVNDFQSKCVDIADPKEEGVCLGRKTRGSIQDTKAYAVQRTHLIIAKRKGEICRLLLCILSGIGLCANSGEQSHGLRFKIAQEAREELYNT
ncbi:hypothetical protein Tco_1306303 [Tanacetum coccineum]